MSCCCVIQYGNADTMAVSGMPALCCHALPYITVIPQYASMLYASQHFARRRQTSPHDGDYICYQMVLPPLTTDCQSLQKCTWPDVHKKPHVAHSFHYSCQMSHEQLPEVQCEEIAPSVFTGFRSASVEAESACQVLPAGLHLWSLKKALALLLHTKY